MLLIAPGFVGQARADSAASVLSTYIADIAAPDLVAGADGFGPLRDDLPVVSVLKGDQTIGGAFVTWDFVGTTGYSGKPIRTMVAVGPDAKVIGVRLVKHSEPIVLIGIPDAKMKALSAEYIGLALSRQDAQTAICSCTTRPTPASPACAAT